MSSSTDTQEIFSLHRPHTQYMMEFTAALEFQISSQPFAHAYNQTNEQSESQRFNFLFYPDYQQ